MLDLFKKIMNKAVTNKQGAAEQEADPETELQIATCAVLLEIAHADDDFSAQEEQIIVDLMEKHFQIPRETVHKIKEISDERRKGSIDLWQFTNTIKKSFSAEQKKRVVEMIWDVIYADEKLDAYEDYLVHKLAKLLGVDHKQLIEAKLKVKLQRKQPSGG